MTDELEKFLHSEEGITRMSAKMKNQRKMAYVAILSMLGVTLILLTPLIPESRIEVLADPLGWFYISMAGIAGAYMGMSGWMNKK